MPHPHASPGHGLYLVKVEMWNVNADGSRKLEAHSTGVNNIQYIIDDRQVRVYFEGNIFCVKPNLGEKSGAGLWRLHTARRVDQSCPGFFPDPEASAAV